MVRAVDRPRNILRPDGLVDPDRVVAGEAAQASCQEGLEDEVPPVLLADDDHERRPVDACRGDAADRVAEAGGRVDEHERGLAAPDRVAGRHPEHRALVQPEHEPEVVGQAGEERHLRGAGVREEGRQPASAEDVERRIADCASRSPDLCRRPRRSGRASPTARPRSARCPRPSRRSRTAARGRAAREARASPPPRCGASARPSTRARLASSSRGRARPACRPSAGSAAARSRPSARRPTP